MKKIEADGYKFKDFKISLRMMDSVTRYVEDGYIPGDFLQAIICNDLSKAVAHADEKNLENIPAYVGYFYNEAPQGCWGSKKAMEEWHKQGGKNS